MIAKCTGNSSEHIGPDAIANFRKHVHQDELHLVIGRDYVVYGVLFRDGQPWFLVCEEDADGYPKTHFGALFELVDDRVPPDWSLSLAESNVGPVSILPRKWAKDPRFLEKLVDEDPIAIADFLSLRQALESWHVLSTNT